MSESSELISSVTHPSSAQNAFLKAASDGFPLAVSVFAYGLAYGALAHTENHLSIWQTLAMSVFVFAGASQFTVLALLHQGAAIWTIVSSAFLLNARQMLYGFTLGPSFRHVAPSKLLFLSHGLTDESFSITVLEAKRRPLPALYFAGAGSIVFFPWFLSSAIGFIAGGLIGTPQQYGLDFAFIGAFLGLLVAQLHSTRQIATVLLAAGLSCVAYHFYSTTGAIVSGACISFLIGVTSRDGD